MSEYFEIVFIKRRTPTAQREMERCLETLRVPYGRHGTSFFGGRELVVSEGYSHDRDWHETYVSIPYVKFTRDRLDYEIKPFREFVQHVFDVDRSVVLAVSAYEISVVMLDEADSFDDVVEPSFLSRFPIVFRRSDVNGRVVVDYHEEAQDIFSVM